MGKIVIMFELPDMTNKEYDAIMSELNEQGKIYNEHRPSHVAFNKDGKWCVVDVWDSAEDLDEFISGTLGPIFQKLNIPAPQPAVYPVHNYLGARAEELVSA
jgi:hypothetical protein